MTLRLRRIKSYRPRKRRTKQQMQKQKLKEMQRHISAHVGRLLVMTKEGSGDQVKSLRERAQAEFLKTAPEMQHIAEHMNGKIAATVRKYLTSVDQLFHCNIICLDPAIIDECYTLGRLLEQNLEVA